MCMGKMMIVLMVDVSFTYICIHASEDVHLTFSNTICSLSCVAERKAGMVRRREEDGGRRAAAVEGEENHYCQLRWQYYCQLWWQQINREKMDHACKVKSRIAG